MKRTAIVLTALLLTMPVLGHAQATRQPASQASQGIHFVQGLSWSQVLAKAKAEQKYVLVNAVASACAPCQAMRDTVFPQAEVGSHMNPRFLAVALQMDRTAQDSKAVQARYADAERLQQEYGISSFPTLLLFSPEGKLVNRVGVTDAAGLITTADEAVRYDTLSRRYLAGPQEAALPAADSFQFLAGIAARVQDRAVADKYAAALLASDIYRTFTKENLGNLAQLASLGSQSVAFQAFYYQGARIDRVMWNGTATAMYWFAPSYADAVVNAIIHNEEVVPALGEAMKGEGDPDWAAVSARIAQKYSRARADWLVEAAKIGWYESWKPHKTAADAAQVRRSKAKLIQDFGGQLSGHILNDYAYELFLHGDRGQAEPAIGWMRERVRLLLLGNKEVKELASNEIDTYASLLYKVGRVAEAIQWEEQALALAPQGSGDQWEKVLRAMRAGRPVTDKWPE